MNGSTGANQSRPHATKLLKSCEPCRLSKSKCLAGDGPHAQSCQRCYKLGKTCVFNYAQPRPKRGKQVRGVGRVAVVEQKVDDIHALLRSLQQPKTTDSPGSETHTSGPDDGSTQPPSLSYTYSSSSTPSTYTSSKENAQPDIFDQGLLTLEQGNEILSTFKEMDTNYPFVPLENYTDVSSLRSQRPFLLLSIMTTASYRNYYDLSWKLDDILRNQLARIIVVEGKRSLDILQGFLVYLTWIHHHYNNERSQMYQYLCLIASIAIDMGLNRSSKAIARPRYEYSSKTSGPGKMDAPSSTPPMEERRTTVATYILCSSLSLGLRRPSFFPYNEYIAECCTTLAQYKEFPSDTSLSQMVQLQRIMDESTGLYHDGNASLLSSTSGFQGPLVDISVSRELFQHHARSTRARIADLQRTLPDDSDRIVSLSLAYHAAGLYVHEACLKMKPQASTSQTLGSKNGGSEASPADDFLVRMLMTTLSLVHELLSYFVNMPEESLIHLTILDFMRLTYALVVLGKLSLNSTLLEALAMLPTPIDIRMVEFVDGLVVRLDRIIGRDEAGEERKDGYWYLRGMIKAMKIWHVTRAPLEKQGDGTEAGHTEDKFDYDPLKMIDTLCRDKMSLMAHNEAEETAAGDKSGNFTENQQPRPTDGMPVSEDWQMQWQPNDEFWDDIVSWPLEFSAAVNVWG